MPPWYLAPADTVARKEKLRTHNILVVSLEGAQYLVDVGFASSSPR